MDQHHHDGRGRSPSAAASASPGARRTSHIRNSHSPSPAPPFDQSDPASSSSASSLGLGLGLDASSPQQFPGAASTPDYSAYSAAVSNPSGFLSPQGAFVDLNPDLSPQDPFGAGAQAQPGFSQGGDFLSPDFNQGDFSLFPPTTGVDQLSNAPLFLNDQDLSMASSQPHHSPTPPHLLRPEPPSGHASPSFSQHPFSSPPGGHSRNVSLGPEAALMPGRLDWSATQFRTHRRTPSEYSDVSSNAGHSPNMVSQDTFSDIDHRHHSPMQRPQRDSGLYSELHGIGAFSISDAVQGRSPSHSPAMSPRIVPQPLPDMGQGNNGFVLGQNNGFSPPQMSYGLQAPEAFPSLPTTGAEMSLPQMPQLNAPTINIDYAPVPARGGFDNPQKSMMDTDALTPPDRGTYDG